MNATELAAELVITKAHLAALNAAITALQDPTVHRYDLDTGQTRTVVWRHELPKIFQQRRELMNEICMMGARKDGAGIIVQPGF